MIRFFSFSMIITLALCLEFSALPVLSQEHEAYLKGYRGPYRGRVIDAETKQPLSGAVVVAIWGRTEGDASHALVVFHDAREALTDSEGDFILNAEDIEAGAPDLTFRPTFFVFLPGYGSYPDFQVAPKGLISGIFEGTGATIELPRLNTAAERVKILNALPVAIPNQKVPNLMRLVQTERVNLGLAPPEQK